MNNVTILVTAISAREWLVVHVVYHFIYFILFYFIISLKNIQYIITIIAIVD